MAVIVDLDAILLELGQFGRYQIRNYCFIMVVILMSAVYNSQYIFAAADIPYRCAVPECESSPPEFVTGSWGSWALPDAGASCERLVPTAQECAPSSFSTNETKRCTSWVYENHDTIVAEFDLACEEWRRTLVGTIHVAGLFGALPVTAYISDMYGRRTALILTAVCPVLMGVIRSFSQSYIMYLCFEFLDSLVGGGLYSTGFIMALEMVGLDKRVLGGNLVSSTYALGQVLTAGVAWLVPYWRNYLLVIYIPSVIFITYYWFIDESVRWLLSKGRNKEAAKIIFKAANMNGKKLSSDTIKLFAEEPEKLPQIDDKAQIEEDKRSILMQVVRSRTLMLRLLVCSFWWITLTFVYYGLSINSVSLAGSSYVNYILTSLVEIPGYCLSGLTLNRFGRKSCTMTAFIICGLSLVAIPFVPVYNPEHAGQAVHQHGDEQRVHLYRGAVPHAGTPHHARHLLHDRQDRRGRGATDTAAHGVHGSTSIPVVWWDGGHSGATDAVDPRDAEGAPARHHRAGREHGKKEGRRGVVVLI
ncbi:hypothetical protein PYW08_002986 [Mythimna loreyi]|uniref:Uncharacterized protein n=1 Tax=Mythimna loreyi TaxID=667449 RepID=A0ACC2QRV3_9NEOP|nr:hypothetical protein PYW08_002986 [Mythimna loreyi]